MTGSRSTSGPTFHTEPIRPEMPRAETASDTEPSGVVGPFPRADRYGPAVQQAVMNLLADGRLSETGKGPATGALEDAFAEMVGTRHALSFNSGTAALHAALHAVGAGPGLGVAVTPMTWISALTAIFQAGSYPVFCDVDDDAPTATAETVAAVRDRCSAVLVTHAWGVPAPMDALTASGSLPVVEDCSHAHGALYRGRPVGSWGAAGCFSLQESKAVSGGEGGILTTGDTGLYQRAMTLGHHPHRLATEVTDPDLLDLTVTGAAYKFRMPALSAVIAREQLRSLAARMDAAQTNWDILRDLVERHGLPIRFPALAEGSRRGWYGTPLLLDLDVLRPRELHEACLAARIPVRDLYSDWLAAPLLQRKDLLARFWPHIACTGYRAASRSEFPAYERLRRQLLILKIPDQPAPAYMRQVGDALAAVLRQFDTRH